jgi:outer membrane biogenesis lipoprotein LolB
MHAHRWFTRSGVALAVLLACAATAPAQQEQRPLVASTPVRQDLRSPDARDSAEGRPSPAETFTLIRLVPDRRASATEASGFHMRDAAVGAAAAIGLILLAAGTVLSLRRRHRDQPFSVVLQQRSL